MKVLYCSMAACLCFLLLVACAPVPEDISSVSLPAGTLDLVPSPALSSTPHVSDQLAFLSQIDDGWALSVLWLDETAPLRLTGSEMAVSHFSWSPDGTQIVFEAAVLGEREIYRVDADGSNLIQLTDSPGYSRHPVWSPDGKHIAFLSDRYGNWGLFVMDVDGGTVIKLADVSTGDYPPRWAPDGQSLVFMSLRGGLELYWVRVDGRGLTQITSSQWTLPSPPPISAWSMEPTWSPDGQTLAFMGFQGDDLSPKIYVIDLLEGNPVRLTADAETTYWHPVWSPDGRHIAFTSQLGSKAELSMLTAGKSVRVTLSRIESADIYLSWSPDSQQLAFESREEEDREIFVVDIDTGLRRKLTDNEVDDCCPAWSP